MTMVGKRTATVCVVCSFLYLACVATERVPPSMYTYKVTPSFDNGLSKCRINVPSLRVTNVFSCAMYCLRFRGCTLYCLNGQECTLYTAQITTLWPGFSDIHQFDKCFSTWHDPHDLARFVTNFRASSVFTVGIDIRLPSLTINGFYCSLSSQCFMSGSARSHWLRIELGAPRTVTSIRVQTRRDATSFVTFGNVVVLLGNSSAYTDNPVFDKMIGMAPTAKLVIFKGTSAVTGQYIQFSSRLIYSEYLSICSLQIIGY